MTGSPVVQRARDLAADVRRAADATERAGTLPDDIVASFRQAGLFAMLVPEEVGGEGVDLLSAMEAMEIISRADGSTGWALMANATSGLMTGAHCGDKAAEVIFGGDRCPVIAGMLGPGGSCVQVDGGYQGSGSYRFGSGSGHADWLAAGLLVMDGGKPRKMASGAVEIRVVVVPRSAVEIRGNWDVFGLVGTGSYDYHLPEQFVDADFSYEVTSIVSRRGRRWIEIGVFGFSALGHGAVALGIMARALEEIAHIAPDKKRLGYRDGVGNHPIFLHDFAHQEAMFQSARAYLYDLFGKAQAILLAGGDLDDEMRHRFRQALTFVHRVGEEVVDWCYRWAGTDALRNPHPLGRCLRDMHAATQHLFVDPLTYVDAAPAIVDGWRRA